MSEAEQAFTVDTAPLFPFGLARGWRCRTLGTWVCSLGALLSACSGNGNTATPDSTATTDSSPSDSQVGDSAAATDTVSAGDTAADSKTDVSSASILQAIPLQFSEDLNGVWGSSANDVWVVGSGGRVLHWNGCALAPRNAGTTKDLFAIGGRSASDVWIAGDGVVLHWDGKTFSDKTPKGAGILRAVGAATDGGSLFVAGDKGAVWRLTQDGSWKAEATASSLDIKAIAAVDSSLVWAVGPQGQALKLSGGSWSATAMPKASKTLRAVTAAPGGRLFAGGDGGFLAATDNGTWTATLANDPQSRDIMALWAPSQDEAWGIGTQGVLMHFVAKKWQLEDIAGTYMKGGDFQAVWGSSEADKTKRNGFAVGKNGAGVRYDAANTAWQDFAATTAADLKSVATGTDGSVAVVGACGLLLRADSIGGPLYDLAVGISPTDLNDVTVDASGQVWAVGAGGRVVNWSAATGSSNSIINSGKDLQGIASNGATVLAVGTNGTAWRNDGSTWTAESTGTQLPLKSVALGAKDGFAVGDFGTILHRDSSGQWAVEDSGAIGNLTRVLTWGDGEAAAVGEGGIVLVRQNGVWNQAFQAPASNLMGLTRLGDGRLVAVGFGGAVVVGKPGGTFQLLQGGKGFLLGAATSLVGGADKGSIAVGIQGSVFLIAENLL